MNITRKELTRIKKEAIKEAFKSVLMIVIVYGFIGFMFLQVLLKLCK